MLFYRSLGDFGLKWLRLLTHKSQRVVAGNRRHSDPKARESADIRYWQKLTGPQFGAGSVPKNRLYMHELPWSWTFVNILIAIYFLGD